MDHDLEDVDYTYTPNPDGPTFSGKLRLKMPGELLGGDVNTRITSDFEWTIVGPWPPTQTPPVVTAAAARATTSSTS
jgi:hypothetical protein